MSGKALRILLAALVVGLLTLIGALLFGHGVEHKPAGGLPWAGSGTAWALPIAALPARRRGHRHGRLPAAGGRAAARPQGRARPVGAGGASDRPGGGRRSGCSRSCWRGCSRSRRRRPSRSGRLHGSNISFYVTNVTEGETDLAVAIVALLILLTPAISRVNSVAVLLGRRDRRPGAAAAADRPLGQRRQSRRWR